MPCRGRTLDEYLPKMGISQHGVKRKACLGGSAQNESARQDDARREVE